MFFRHLKKNINRMQILSPRATPPPPHMKNDQVVCSMHNAKRPHLKQHIKKKIAYICKHASEHHHYLFM